MSILPIDIDNYLYFESLYTNEDSENAKQAYLDMTECDQDTLLYNICQAHNLGMLQWIFTMEVDMYPCEYPLLETAGISKSYAIITWLYEAGHIKHGDIYSFAKTFNKTNDLEIMQWVHGLIHFTDDVQALIFSKGSLNIKQWVYSLGNITVGEVKTLWVECSYKDQTLEIAQWIYSLGLLELTDEDMCERFTHACAHNFELAQWLFSISNMQHNQYSATWNTIFTQACHNSLEVAMWVYDLPGVSEKDFQWFNIFDEMCKYQYPDKLDIICWLHTLVPHINIRDYNDKIFKFNRYWRNTVILEWLLYICPDYTHTPERGYIIRDIET
jgi:hypothetical protein